MQLVERTIYSTDRVGTKTYGRQRPYYEVSGKRVFDVMTVLLFAPVWVVLVLVLAVIARIETGQLFYADTRVGRDGVRFTCWKICTMHTNPFRGCAAEKKHDDPRITYFGKLLRKSSLDELPQLWCVLIGQMSLVGPRPVPSVELLRYGSMRATYLSLRPGLTGLWQVSGRNSLSYGERICLDVRYARTLSFHRDLTLLLATVREVLCLNGR